MLSEDERSAVLYAVKRMNALGNRQDDNIQAVADEMCVALERNLKVSSKHDN